MREVAARLVSAQSSGNGFDSCGSSKEAISRVRGCEHMIDTFLSGGKSRSISDVAFSRIGLVP